MVAKNLLFGTVVLVAAIYIVGQVLPDWRDAPHPAAPADEADISRVAGEVDEEFVREWNRRGLTPADAADDLIVIRRLSLALTGTIPSLEEIRQIEAVKDEDRVDWWVRRLLSEERYADYVAERLARAWVGVEDGPFIIYRRRRFVSWTSEQLKANRPYNELVQSLLTDSGLWTDTPAVNFFTVTVDDEAGQPDPVRLAARTTRAFLGLRIDCLQCHDDALGTMELGSPDAIRTGTQQDFHQLAAFFSSVRQTAAGLQDTRKEEDYRFKYLHEEHDEVVPCDVPYQKDLLPDNGTRRERLAEWITAPDNSAFSRAAVNRVWAILVGTPLVDPVDDIPLYGSRKPGLDRLAEDFAESGFDLQRLIRVIARTRVFRQSSFASFEVTEAHWKNFAVFPQIPLRPEQVVGGLIQASSLTTIDDRSNVFEKLVTFGDTNEFIVRYGDRGEDEFRMRGGTIQQKNILMNGKVVSERTRANDLLLNASSQIAAFADSDGQAIESLFLVTLTRRPTVSEQAWLVDLLGQTPNRRKRREAIEDILWALFNKVEFQVNH